MRRALLMAAIAVLLGGCRQDVRVSKTMYWRCAPEMRDPACPGAEPVILTYPERPSCFDLVFSRGLCGRLAAAAKKEVTVDYEAWSDWRGALLGYRIAAIDGRPLTDLGACSGGGQQGPTEPCPLDELFR